MSDLELRVLFRDSAWRWRLGATDVVELWAGSKLLGAIPGSMVTDMVKDYMNRLAILHYFETKLAESRAIPAEPEGPSPKVRRDRQEARRKPLKKAFKKTGGSTMTTILLTLALLLTLATPTTAGLLLEIRPVLLDSGAPVEDEVLWQTTVAAPAPGTVGLVSVPIAPLAVWSGQTLALVLTTTETEGAWWAGARAGYVPGTPFVDLAADPYWQGVIGHDFGFALCVGDGYDPCTTGPSFLPKLVSVWAPLQPGIGWAQTFLVETDGMLEGVSVLLAGSDIAQAVPLPPTWLLLGLGGLLVLRRLR